MTRVLIKHNSAVARYLLTEIIDNEHDMEVVGTVQDNASAMTRIMTLNPDVLILDMPDSSKDEIYVIRRLLQNCSMPAIVLIAENSKSLSDHSEPGEIGAFDYIYGDANLTWGGILRVADDIIAKIRSAASANPNKGIIINDRLKGNAPSF